MWVGDNDASLDAIVDDVMRRWQARSEDDPETLDGPNGFWVRYATGVEWASTTSDQFRAEFCSPVQGAPFDTGDYFHAVWTAHVALLRRASERSGTTA